MKDIITVSKFTMKEMMRRKSFIVTTIILMIIIVIGFNVPKLIKFFSNDSGEMLQGEKIIISDSKNIYEGKLDKLNEQQNELEYKIEINPCSFDEIKTKINNDEIKAGLIIEKNGDNILFRYIVNDTMATIPQNLNEALQKLYTNTKIETEKIPYALNSKLPNSIVIKSAEEVDERFHARYACKGKTYRYLINMNEFPSALNRYREFHVGKKLNLEAMKEALKYFEGTHDFKGFKSSGGNEKKTTVRTIYKTSLIENDGIVAVELSGDGFLYNMVRIIVGTIVDVGLGKINAKDIPNIIESQERSKAGKTLPPHGLYLVEVKY